MKIHNIAGLTTHMEYYYERLSKQAEAYVTNEQDTPDILIHFSKDYLRERQKENPHLSMNECEYIWTGAEFYHQLLNYRGFMLHASGVVYKGYAYLFSAPSGTGKSTHTGLWQKHFGSKAQIINDDKPAIRIHEDGVFVYGTPWSGKTALNLNIKVPLKAICFIERSPKNHIRQIPARDAIGMILNQTLRPPDLSQMDKLLACLDTLLQKIPIYQMGCNISEEAAELAYRTMSQGTL